MFFVIKYENPPMKGIFTAKVKAKDAEMARSIFQTNNPRSKIKEVELLET